VTSSAVSFFDPVCLEIGVGFGPARVGKFPNLLGLAVHDTIFGGALLGLLPFCALARRAEINRVGH
jgi:hypothetical protein